MNTSLEKDVEETALGIGSSRRQKFLKNTEFKNKCINIQIIYRNDETQILKKFYQTDFVKKRILFFKINF